MKKFLVIICGIFMIFSAFATGENIPTSKSYVDAEIATKQNKIAATDGAPQVLMNTGTAGEYGTKNIYDSTGSYATQTDALIDAVTMNTAVQNAIDSEFQCVEYNPNDPTDCWLMDIRGVTGKSTLPTGYTALEYISTKDTYVSGGWNPTIQTYKIKAKFRFNSLSNTKYNAIFGADGGMFFGVSADGYWAPHMLTIPYAYATISPLIPINTGVWYTMEDVLDRTKTSNNMYGSINGITYTGYRSAPGTSYAWLIGSFSSATSLYNCFDGDIAYIKVYENDVMIHNYVPARHDNAIGMYDMVSNTFFTNSGTDDFIPGPVVNLYLPSN